MCEPNYIRTWWIDIDGRPAGAVRATSDSAARMKIRHELRVAPLVVTPDGMTPYEFRVALHRATFTPQERVESCD